MFGKFLIGAAALMLGANAHAAADYPSGYTKCAQVGSSCSMSGSHTVALGKSGSFVYATLTGNFTCAQSLFTGGSAYTASAWCSVGPVVTAASSSSASSSSAAASSVAVSSAARSSVAASVASSAASSAAQSSSAAVSSSASSNPYVTGCGTETSNLVASRVYYVTPTAASTGAGTSFSAPMSFTAALSAVSAGQMILLQPGTYSVPYTAGAKNTLTLAKSGSASARIYMVAANCGKAVIDFSFPENTYVQDSYGFYLTGSYWYFKGIEITRAGYQGVYVTGGYNTFENVAFHNNRNSGLEINKGGHHTTVINSDAYRNYDPKKNGSMADGFASKQTQGAGNFFYGCRAWENSDDGWDTFDSAETVTIENSWTFRNGVDVWGYGNFAGNGNGFKLGGNYKLQRNRIINSVSFGHPNKGFDQNNNVGGVTVINNTSFQNGINYGFGGALTAGEQNVFANNVSLSGKAADSIANATSKTNTWNGIAVSSADFLSVDTNLASRSRNPDGSLVYTTLFRLVAGSKLINAGSNAGLPYLGSAPDLGAFERE
ncbi:right-handed parallel beta-helix repeat-containing protein [Uliginosibacterium sp. 31-12]|uniref:right-handed parallel beta-helix repeat-containing protein n=1 Tax=Uliginosibacterium sp. 31-12 TaxID=3062781 RepID=UPI0026E2AD6F|nr:right-handed parallel beta-helix repeat-containing protein [Uliginosibacterium sp. 31-12]MDO6387838.1 right-handed parallel beta-helix repeat-containing protein [Uliginosibacterium sp. 31-12]